MATRTFKMGHADCFQDKPNELLESLIKNGKNKEREKALEITDGKILGFALQLKDKTEAEISTVLNSIVERVKYLKTQNL